MGKRGSRKPPTARLPTGRVAWVKRPIVTPQGATGGRFVETTQGLLDAADARVGALRRRLATAAWRLTDREVELIDGSVREAALCNSEQGVLLSIVQFDLNNPDRLTSRVTSGFAGLRLAGYLAFTIALAAEGAENPRPTEKRTLR